MPTYEYQCEACGNRFEKYQQITAAPIRKCPKCGKSRVKRLLGTGAGIIFKGSGFYTTDYRDKSYADRAKADVAPAATEAKKDAADATKTASTDAKSDKKAEPRTESKPAASESKPAEKSASKSAKKRKR